MLKGLALKINVALLLLFASLGVAYSATQITLPAPTVSTCTPQPKCFSYDAVVPVDGVTGTPYSSSNPLPVSASVTPPVDYVASGNITSLNANLNSGTASANSTVSTSTLNSVSTANVVVTGTFSATLVFQISTDGSNWTSLPTITKISDSSTSPNITATGNYQVPIPASVNFRVTASSYTSGTAAISIRASSGISSGGGGGSSVVTANAGTNLNTSQLALNTSVTGLQVAQGSTTSGQSGSLIQGAVTTSAPTYTTAQTSPLSLDTAGNLRVITSTSGSAATAANQSTEITSLNSIVTNTANLPSAGQKTSANSLPVVLPSDQATTANPIGVKISDGTQIANTWAGISGNTQSNQNGLIVVPVSQQATISISTNTFTFYDTGNARYACIYLTSVGGGTVSIGSSQDTNSAHVDALIWYTNSGSNATNLAISKNYCGVVYGRYLSLQTSSLSGTVSGIITLQSQPLNPVVQVVNSLPSGGNNLGLVVPASGTSGGASFANMTTSTTTTIKSGAGTFYGIWINTRGTGSTAKCYDNTAASGTALTGSIDTTLSTTAFSSGSVGVAFSTGLTCITTGASPADIGIYYK